MKKVIVIEEDGHGIIGVAKDYKSAVHFLINNEWLSNHTDMYDNETKEYIEVESLLGEDWKDIILNEWDIDTFCKKFDSVFFLTEENVYMAEE